jgi:hypothetical protein
VAFNVLFQEAITTRYGLPIVAPMAYLAARGGMMIAPGRWASALVIALGVASAAVGQASVYQYTQARAPAFQLLEDMASAGRDGPPIVFAMHRREELDFRRPIRWVGTRMPAVETRLAAPPKREWLEIVKYWNSGGRRPVWFIADPLRSDLALFDRSDRITSYRWSLAYPSLVGGARPGVMDWHVFDRPGWYLGEGWALTPESAGVAVQDRRGPGLAPIEGWIRRRAQPTTVLVGGRNLNRDGAPASLTITLDGRTIDQTVLPGGFFWKMMPLSSGVLDGVGDYAAIRIAAAGDVAIEQFDAQSPDRVVVAFAEGWHEREYDPVKGRLWRWMSERGTLRVRGTGEAHTLVLSGGTETFRRPSRLVVRAGDRQIAEHTVGSSFAITVPLPAEHLPPSESVITIETDQVYVPAEHSSGSQDRRRLALKIFECRLEPTQGFSGLPGQTQ